MNESRRRGFTLREIAIVLVILGIAAAAAVPAFGRLGERDVVRPEDAVTWLLRESRRIAVERGVTVWVTLDPASGHFRVDTAGMAGTGTVADTTLELESGTTIEADSVRTSFVFRPNGSAVADSLVIQSPRATTVVRVDPWNGRVDTDAL